MGGDVLQPGGAARAEGERREIIVKKTGHFAKATVGYTGLQQFLYIRKVNLPEIGQADPLPGEPLAQILQHGLVHSVEPVVPGQVEQLRRRGRPPLILRKCSGLRQFQHQIPPKTSGFS